MDILDIIGKECKMALEIFKGLTKAMAPMVAKKIGKEEFLDQLRVAWIPVVKKNTDIDLEVTNAMDRIRKSGFEKTFKTVGVTDEDIKKVLEDIRDSKGESVVRSEPKVGRNELCPCGSGKKYKRCCGK